MACGCEIIECWSGTFSKSDISRLAFKCGVMEFGTKVGEEKWKIEPMKGQLDGIDGSIKEDGNPGKEFEMKEEFWGKEASNPLFEMM